MTNTQLSILLWVASNDHQMTECIVMGCNRTDLTRAWSMDGGAQTVGLWESLACQCMLMDSRRSKRKEAAQRHKAWDSQDQVTESAGTSADKTSPRTSPGHAQPSLSPLHASVVAGELIPGCLQGVASVWCASHVHSSAAALLHVSGWFAPSCHD